MLKRIFSSTVITATAFSAVLASVALPASAASSPAYQAPTGGYMPKYGINSELVIKGSGSALYWYGWDQKKHLFPNTATFYTWYSDMKNVKRVTDKVLLSIPTGTPVVYRPGAKLVKFSGATTVYAVSRYGVLRPIANPTVASALYPSWTKQLHTLPLAVKKDYTVGTTISNAWDYNVSEEYGNVYSPSDSYGIGAVNVSSFSIKARAETETVNVGDYASIYTDLFYNGNPAVEKAGIVTTKVYDQWGTVLKTCVGAQYCDYEFTPTADQAGKKLGYYAVTTVAGKNVYSNSTFVTVTNQLKPFSGTVSLYAGIPVVDASGNTSVMLQGSFYANSDGKGGMYSAYTGKIIDGRTNAVLATCPSTTTCGYTVNFGQTYAQNKNVPYYFAVYSASGLEMQRAYAYVNAQETDILPVPTPTPVPMPAPAPAPVSTSFMGLASIYQWSTGKPGMPLSVSANLDGSSVPVDQLRATIYDFRTGTVVGVCEKSLTCSATYASAELIQNGSLVQATWTNLLTGQTVVSPQMALVVNP